MTTRRRVLRAVLAVSTALVVALSVTGGGTATAADDPAEAPAASRPVTGVSSTATTATPSIPVATSSTSTTLAPVGVEAGPAPDPSISTTVASAAPTVAVAAPAAAVEHDGGWDGESPLATSTDLAGPGSVAYGEAFTLEITVTNVFGIAHLHPRGEVDVYRAAPGNPDGQLVARVELAGDDVPGSPDPVATATYSEPGGLTLGRYTYWAQYGGQEGGWTGEDGPYDPGFDGSVSPPIDVEVAAIPTTALLIASTGYLYEGNDVELTAVVQRAPDGGQPAPSGTVAFYEGESLLSVVELVDGIAHFTVAQPTLGDHEYTVYYWGDDAGFAAARPSDVWVQVDLPPSPIVTLSSSPASGAVLTVGTTVVFTATIEPPWGEEGGPTFPGSVGYYEDGQPVGSAPVGTSFTFAPGVGSHGYTAVYEGAPGAWSPSEASNVANFTVHEVVTTSTTSVSTTSVSTTSTSTTSTSTTSTSTTSTSTTSTIAPPTSFPTDPVPPISVPPGGAGVPGDTGAAVGTRVGRLTVGTSAVPTVLGPPVGRIAPTPSIPPEAEPALGRERAAGIVVDVQVDEPAGRSELVFGIPDPRDVDWSGRHVRQNLILTLLLILLIALPAELFNSTLKEHYHRVNRPLRGIQAWLAALEAHLLTAPNGVLLVGFALVGAAIASQLDPSFGLNPTSMVLFAALALAFVAITLVLELARIPYLDRRAGRRREHHLRLFPLVLILGAVFVLVSRLAEFRPGYVFGITCGLLLADDVGEEDNARSLVMAAVLLLATSLGAWLLWLPLVDEVRGPSPSLWVLFGDAFLATLWISCLQVVVFGYAPLEALYGKIVQRWSWPAWIVVYGVAVFLLVSFLLHPSAGRWGGLTTTTFFQMMTLFVLFLVASVVLWAWFRFRPDPPQKGADEAPAVTSDQG